MSPTFRMSPTGTFSRKVLRTFREETGRAAYGGASIWCPLKVTASIRQGEQPGQARLPANVLLRVHLTEGAALPRRRRHPPKQPSPDRLRWARAPKARLPGLLAGNAQHFRRNKARR